MDQGLPVNFENTASTWQNMPGLAAFYTGLQNQAAQDNIQMLQRAFAEEQAFKGQTRPLEMEKMRGLNELQAAQAMSARATGRKTGLDADLMAGTLASDIEAKTGANALALKENKVKEGAAKAAMFNQMSGWLKGDGKRYPPIEQVRVVMEKLGIEDTPDRRVSTGLLENLNKLPDMFAAEYNHLVKSSPEYQKTSLMEEGNTKRTSMNNATTRYVADKASADRALDRDERANALKEKEQKKNDFNANIMKAKTASEVINRMIVEAQRAEAAGELEWARELKTRINNPTLQNNYRNEMNNAGTSAVTQQPGERPKLGPRSGEVPVVPFSLGEDATAAPADPMEGRTATGPDGKKIIRKNGKWVPL